jgi:hypothetical protein
MKRLLALLVGGLGLRALLRRRGGSRLSPVPAEDLKAKLAAARATTEPPPVVAEEPAPEEPAPEEPAVEGRRADVHAKARQAIDELRES